MGCDKDPTHQTEKEGAEQVSKRTIPFRETLDWTQPYQLLSFGDTIIKIPSDHLSRVNEENVILEADIVVDQEGKPKFLTSTEEIQKALPFDTYNNVFVYVSKTPAHGRFTKYDVESAIRLSFLGPLNPPQIMEELGLKRYSTDSGNPLSVYFSLDPNFTMPGGGIFFMSCDPVPADPKKVKSCSAHFGHKGVNVRYSFPPQYLRYWKDVHQFVLDALQFTN